MNPSFLAPELVHHINGPHLIDLTLRYYDKKDIATSGVIHKHGIDSVLSAEVALLASSGFVVGQAEDREFVGYFFRRASEAQNVGHLVSNVFREVIASRNFRKAIETGSVPGLHDPEPALYGESFTLRLSFEFYSQSLFEVFEPPLLLGLHHYVSRKGEEPARVDMYAATLVRRAPRDQASPEEANHLDENFRANAFSLLDAEYRIEPADSAHLSRLSLTAS
jgi:hypothetical protein